MAMLLATLRDFNAERDNKIHVWLRLLSGLLFMNYSFVFKSKSTCTCLCNSWTVVYRPYATLSRISLVSFHLKISRLLLMTLIILVTYWLCCIIAGYKSRFVACRVSSSIFGFSARTHIKTSSTKSWKISTCVFQ